SGGRRGLTAYSAIYLPKKTMHCFDMSAQVSGLAVFLGVGVDIGLEADKVHHLRVKEATHQAEITGLIDTALREASASDPFASEALFHVCALIGVTLKRFGTEVAAIHRKPLAERFATLVEEQLYTGQNVSEFAEALGVTPTHLSRVCKESCGLSASDILTDRRTSEAQRLLAETALPVRKVADILGYTSAAYFTRAFRARTGTTPSEFRRVRSV
ncbi:MAG: helix-turn-helix transcriptional regulator, partial [Pseudomonadota bacterium]